MHVELAPAVGTSEPAAGDDPLGERLPKRISRYRLSPFLLVDWVLAGRDPVVIRATASIYHPASDSDSMMLGMITKFAEYENKPRIRWSMASRWATAKALELPVLLPQV